MKLKLDERIDFANSIINAATGEAFKTSISRLKPEDKLKGFHFGWEKKLKNGEDIYKLTIINQDIIHGLMCIQDKETYIYIELIESSDINKGSGKAYTGVAGNFFTFVCKLSESKGYDGVFTLTAKTDLIEHYKKTLGAKRVGRSNNMVVDEEAAQILIQKFYTGTDQWEL